MVQCRASLLNKQKPHAVCVPCLRDGSVSSDTLIAHIIGSRRATVWGLRGSSVSSELSASTANSVKRPNCINSINRTEPPGRPVVRLARRGITPSAARAIEPSGGGRPSYPGYAFIDTRPRIFGSTQPTWIRLRRDALLPHKSRSPDAISKPSHPQYFHIRALSA